jgi:two-component system response regulator FixJ
MGEFEGTVFVVEDDPRVRESLLWLLESLDLKVETYASADDFLESYAELGPGCLIVDVWMPGMTGLELQEELSQRGIDLPMVVLTGQGDVEMAVQAMKAGAEDFFQKPFRRQQLLAAVQQCLAKSRKGFRARQRELELRDRLESLTPRERQVLDGIAEGLTSKMIARRLSISPRTVDVHRANLKLKFQAGSTVQLIEVLASIRRMQERSGLSKNT